MEPIWIIVISIGVAACVGGVTNHLAIKMLFHPRQPWKIGGWRIPFTPGIIPKRKNEIAHSLGRIVAEFLVTRDGLLGFLKRPEMKIKLQAKLEQWLEQAAAYPHTWEDLLRNWFSDEDFKGWKDAQHLAINRFISEWLERWLNSHNWADRPVKEWLPGWSEDKKQQASFVFANMIITSIQEELISVHSERMIRNMIHGFLQKSGGFMGALAGIFMQEDRLVHKLKEAILDFSENPEFQAKLVDVVMKKISLWEEKSGVEIFAEITGNSHVNATVLHQWLTDQIVQKINTQELIDRLLQNTIGETVVTLKSHILSFIPGLIEWVWSNMDKGMDRVLKTLELESLVEKQVQTFPVSRLEDIILRVSGKEFRAITWLGALLGGIIGLCQSVLYLYIL